MRTRSSREDGARMSRPGEVFSVSMNYGSLPAFRLLNRSVFGRADPMFNGTYVWRDGYYRHGSFIPLDLRGSEARVRRFMVKRFPTSMTIPGVDEWAHEHDGRLAILSEGLDVAKAKRQLQLEGPIIIPASLALDHEHIECVPVLDSDGSNRILGKRWFRGRHSSATGYLIVLND